MRIERHVDTDRPVLTFRERMSGWFALGEDDPAAGAARGRRERSRLVLHGTIRIDDLGRFLDDPDHTAALDGRLVSPELGIDLPASGRFQLFAPRGEGAKAMVYALSGRPGAHPGDRFVGEKDVAPRSPLRLWPDTTTLFSRLYRGEPEAGEVVGAGVLRISPGALLAMVASFRARRPASLARFGTFFARELWSTYLRGGR